MLLWYKLLFLGNRPKGKENGLLYWIFLDIAILSYYFNSSNNPGRHSLLSHVTDEETDSEKWRKFSSLLIC